MNEEKKEVETKTPEVKEVPEGEEAPTKRRPYVKPVLTHHGKLGQIIRGTSGLFSDTNGPFPTPG